MPSDDRCAGTVRLLVGGGRPFPFRQRDPGISSFRPLTYSQLSAWTSYPLLSLEGGLLAELAKSSRLLAKSREAPTAARCSWFGSRAGGRRSQAPSGKCNMAIVSVHPKSNSASRQQFKAWPPQHTVQATTAHPSRDRSSQAADCVAAFQFTASRCSCPHFQNRTSSSRWYPKLGCLA